jgi:hypothetical protein
MFNRRSGKSLEDTIRDVQKKHKNKPSPLMLNNNVGFAPTQVPNHMRAAPNDIRGNLLGSFRPPNDTFR